MSHHPMPAAAAPMQFSAFDPRQAALIRVDSHLPAVPLAAQTPQALRQRFAHPPAWQPELSQDPGASVQNARQAAVLVPLVMRDELTVLLTQRSWQLSHHSGQIAFPGGRRDPEDVDLTATALREAQEEVGLNPDRVEVLGQLSPYATFNSGFVVTPVVALVSAGQTLRPNPGEVDEVFEVPLRFLLDPSNHQRRWRELAGQRREWLAMPFMEGATERHIWGATAGMLRNFYRFMLPTG